MAQNVYRNISRLTNGVEIISNDNWNEITKIRYVHDETNHTFLRVDTPINIKPLKIEDINFDYKMIITKVIYQKKQLSTYVQIII
jgi:hypothetical protein